MISGYWLFYRVNDSYKSDSLAIIMIMGIVYGFNLSHNDFPFSAEISDK